MKTQNSFVRCPKHHSHNFFDWMATFQIWKHQNHLFFHKFLIWMPTLWISSCQICHFSTISLTECQLFKSKNIKIITFFINSLSECQLFKTQIFQIFNVYQEMTAYFPNTCLQVSLKKFSNSLALTRLLDSRVSEPHVIPVFLEIYPFFRKFSVFFRKFARLSGKIPVFQEI